MVAPPVERALEALENIGPLFCDVLRFGARVTEVTSPAFVV
jgi:hypothetical protein